MYGASVVLGDRVLVAVWVVQMILLFHASQRTGEGVNLLMMKCTALDEQSMALRFGRDTTIYVLCHMPPRSQYFRLEVSPI